MGGYNDWYFPTSVPKRVKGGIKAQKAHGGFASHWWGKRWIQVLESFDLGARLTRGRSYARSGQVTGLDIAPGAVTAEVQGSRSKPYTVSITMKTLTDAQWAQIAKRFTGEPTLAARLLSNEMPEEIETVFAALKLSLFPRTKNDLATDCSCPDWSNPCKHIAAVYYLLAEAFDEDPFLLFRLRGIDRDAFLRRLRGSRATDRAGSPAAIDEAPCPLPAESDAFWTVRPALPRPGEAWEAMEEFAVLPRRLGSLPFWRSEENFHELMETMYASASFAVLNAIIALETDRER